MVFKSEKQPKNTQNHVSTSLNFTDREIDILACLQHGKTTKKIALILNLKVTTVKTHIRKVMKKLNIHSREGIGEHLEQSDHAEFLRLHYEALIKRCHFDKLRLSLAKTIGSQKKTCPIICDKRNLFEKLRQDLRCFGIKIVGKNSKASLSSYEPMITIVTSLQKGQQGWRTEEGCIIDDGDYYRLFWDVLDTFLTHPSIQETRVSFETLFSEDASFDSCDSLDRLDQLINRLDSTLTEKKDQSYNAESNLWQRLKPIYYWPFAAFIVGCIALPVLQETSLFTTAAAVRSSLSLPIDAYLLERPQLLSKITAAFKGKACGGIQTVVLVGMGGMGKTTLARHYARKQTLPVIFELPAHDQKTLISSFSKLAFELAGNSAEKKELESWQSNPNTKDYADKLLPFVAKKLKEKKTKTARKQWLLIFDNVDQFQDIDVLFPKDPQVWGNGDILITTKNEHIACRDQVDPNHVISITPLSVDEKTTLFKKVVRRSLNNQQQKELQVFLTQLPPFPLDVMIAAHYIKRTRISYNTYLRHLASQHPEFEASQHNFLTRTTSYGQTRSAIISSAAQQIIDKNPAFIPLLWAISHLGNHPIPKDLLIHFAGQLTVDRFVDELAHYSLLTGNFDFCQKEEAQSQLLLHQSTQQNMLVYLQRTIDEKNKQRYDESLIQALETYSHRMMVPPVPLGAMKDFSVHLHTLLDDKMISLSPLHRSCIQLLLGSFYCHLVDPVMGKHLLEPSLAYLSSYYRDTLNPRLCRAFLFTGIAARFNGDYEQAKILLEKSISLYERVSSVGAYISLALALRYISYVYKSISEYDKGKVAIERSIALYTKYAPQHPDLALAFSDLAMVYYGGPGDYDKAMFYHLKSLALLHKIYGDDHLNTLSVKGKLGLDYRRIGRYKEALQVFRISYDGLKRNYPHNFDHLSLTTTNLGEMYRLLGDVKQAEFFLKEGVAVATQYFGPDHIHTDWGLIPLAQLYIDIGQYDKAKELLEKSLLGYQKKFGDTHDKTISVYHPLGLAYAHLGLYDKALDCFVKSQKSFSKHYGVTHIDYAIFLKDFGLFYLLSGDYERSETLLNQALTILEKAHHIECYRCFEYLGDLYAKKHQVLQIQRNSCSSDHAVPKACRNQADVYFQQALQIIQGVFSKESFHIGRIQAKRKLLMSAPCSQEKTIIHA